MPESHNSIICSVQSNINSDVGTCPVIAVDGLTARTFTVIISPCFVRNPVYPTSVAFPYQSQTRIWLSDIALV